MRPDKIRTPAVVIIPVGAGRIEETLDTIDSVWHYLGDVQPIIVNLDYGDDETERALRTASRGRLHVLRNPDPGGVGPSPIMEFITHKNAYGYRAAFEAYEAEFLLKMDTDALLTGYGLIDDALAFTRRNPNVGLFGRLFMHADGTIINYRMHTRRMNRELSGWRRLRLNAPAYAPIARRALINGWGRGETVFGGACFFTWRCLEVLYKRGYLSPPRRGWNSKISDDVYFTMCAAAGGFDRGHFAAPVGPLCLAWQKLPLPATEIEARGYKIVHSVDKGENTSGEDNGGMTAREYFRSVRRGKPR